MAIERRFSDIRTTRPISFSVYRDRFCFVGDPMETESSEEGDVAPQQVHAYLMCDEADLPQDQRDGPRIRRAKILALWDGLGASHVRMLAAISRLSRGIVTYRERDIEALQRSEGFRDPKLRALASAERASDGDRARLPTWVACFGAPRILERAPVVFIKRQTGFVDLGSEPVSALLYAGRINGEIAQSLLVELRSFDVLAGG